jgi:divalent metal cation (Fe/Co/Zn/Cd) transporter
MMGTAETRSDAGRGRPAYNRAGIRQSLDTTTVQTRTGAVSRARTLEYLTLAWNSLEAAAAIVSGLLAGSIALVGFGFDSVIECASGATLLWRLRDGEAGERRERTALKLVGVSFLLLAAYIAWDAITALLHREAPRESIFGICVAAASLVAMPLLARAKRKVARELNSGAMQADSRQTDLCAYLSAILLVGLVLNATLHWWWADPVAALIMVPIIVREGWDGLRGKTCSDCHSCDTQ